MTGSAPNRFGSRAASCFVTVVIDGVLRWMEFMQSSAVRRQSADVSGRCDSYAGVHTRHRVSFTFTELSIYSCSLPVCECEKSRDALDWQPIDWSPLGWLMITEDCRQHRQCFVYFLSLTEMCRRTDALPSTPSFDLFLSAFSSPTQSCPFRLYLFTAHELSWIPVRTTVWTAAFEYMCWELTEHQPS